MKFSRKYIRNLKKIRINCQFIPIFFFNLMNVNLAYFLSLTPPPQKKNEHYMTGFRKKSVYCVV